MRAPLPASLALALLALVVVPWGLSAVGATAATASAAPPLPDCGDDADASGVYVTDSGLAVTTAPAISPPERGAFVNATTLRFGNVSVSAEGPASLQLATAGESICLVDVNATAASVRVTFADGEGLVVSGAARSLAVRPVDYGPGAARADLAYSADGPVTVALSTGLPPNTPVEAADADAGGLLATGTVADGRVSLTLPPETTAVDLTVPTTTSGTAVASGTSETTAESTRNSATPSTAGSTPRPTATVTPQEAPGFGTVLALIELGAVAILAGRRDR